MYKLNINIYGLTAFFPGVTRFPPVSPGGNWEKPPESFPQATLSILQSMYIFS